MRFSERTVRNITADGMNVTVQMPRWVSSLRPSLIIVPQLGFGRSSD